jgi:hypothetical protein
VLDSKEQHFKVNLKCDIISRLLQPLTPSDVCFFREPTFQREPLAPITSTPTNPPSSSPQSTIPLYHGHQNQQPTDLKPTNEQAISRRITLIIIFTSSNDDHQASEIWVLSCSP